MEVLIVGDMTGFIGATTRKIEVITLDCMNSREESESSQGCWGRVFKTPCISFCLPIFLDTIWFFSSLAGLNLATKMFQFARLSLACSWIQQAVQKVDRNLRIYAFFQLPEAFRRLLRPSSSLGA